MGVDAKHVGPHLEEEKPEGVENESVEQVAFADKILLNKVDLVSEDEKNEVIAQLRGINQFAEIIETQQSAVDLERILGCKAFDLSRVLQVEADFLDTEGEHMHDDSVSSVGIEFVGSLDLPKLNTWLTALLRDRGVHMLMGISSSDDGVGRAWKEGEARTNR